MELLCEIAGISRSTYYRAINKKEKDEELKERIKEIYFKYNGIYGYRRITIVLKREGIKINHKKVYRLMKELGIYAIIRKKNRIRRLTKEAMCVYVIDRRIYKILQ